VLVVTTVSPVTVSADVAVNHACNKADEPVWVDAQGSASKRVPTKLMVP